MKNTGKMMLIAAVTLVGTAAFAGPHEIHRHDHRTGWTGGIVTFFAELFTPCRPAEVARPMPPPPPPKPHRAQPAKPQHHNHNNHHNDHHRR